MAPKLKRVVEDETAAEAPVQAAAPMNKDALFGPPPSPEFSRLKQGFREIKVDAVRRNPTQARTVFDPEAITALAASIDRHGLQTPIIVRQDSTGGYVLIAGERRLMAHEQLGRKTIPAFVSHGNADEIALVENVQRVDLDAVELATGLHRLVEEMGYTQERVGALVGMKQESVARILGVLRLPPDLLQDYHAASSKISRSALEEFSVLVEKTAPDPGTLSGLWDQLKSGDLGRAEIREEVRAAKTRAQTQTQETPGGHALRKVGLTLKSFARGMAELKAHKDILADDHRQRLLALKAEIDELLA